MGSYIVEALICTCSWNWPINEMCCRFGPPRPRNMALSLTWPFRNRFIWTEMLFRRNCQDAFACRCLLNVLALNAAPAFASSRRSAGLFLGCKEQVRTHKMLLFRSANPQYQSFIQIPQFFARKFSLSQSDFSIKLWQSTSYRQGRCLGTIYEAFISSYLNKSPKIDLLFNILPPCLSFLSSFQWQPSLRIWSILPPLLFLPCVYTRQYPAGINLEVKVCFEN